MGGINDLGALRERLGWTQQVMADALDIGLRTYVDAEASDKPRRVYVLAAQFLASKVPNFDPGVRMPDPADEERAAVVAAMFVAKCALEVSLRHAPDPNEGFNRMAWLWDESNADDNGAVTRRGAFLAGEVLMQYAKEEEDARKGGKVGAG